MCGKCEIQIILETKLPMIHPFTGCSVLQKEQFQTEEKTGEKKTDHCPTAVMIPDNE